MPKKQTPDLLKYPFAGKKVYYSGSITGVEEKDLEFPEQLVGYIEKLGAQVIDPHVAISQKLKKDAFLAALVTSHGLTRKEWENLPPHEQSKRVYQHDIALVDQATHLVALLNGTSFGVAMEIQEALRKPDIGLNLTPILGLVHENFLDRLSLMIKGAAEIYPHFHLQTYQTLTEAQKAIHKFLSI